MESILVVEVYYIEDDENIAQAVKEYLYEKKIVSFRSLQQLQMRRRRLRIICLPLYW